MGFCGFGNDVDECIEMIFDSGHLVDCACDLLYDDNYGKKQLSFAVKKKSFMWKHDKEKFNVCDEDK